MLVAGRSIAIVSDAGTPLISDPGFRIVSRAIERGINVVPVPGANAVVAAVSAAGLPSDKFFFAGFLPARAGARVARLEQLRSLDATLVVYEAPHRIKATLRDAAEILGPRDAVVAREITKLHEEFVRGTLSQLAETFTDKNRARGEIVLLIAAGRETDQEINTQSVSNALAERLASLQQEGLDEKAALKKAARGLGLKRDEAYRLMMAQKNRRSR
jgi:16S rRNA (cytidine1402-2'-O)-methyltransferase